MIIIPMNSINMSDRQAAAIFIVFNFVLLICFSILYYQFYKSSYIGNFWNWSWDSDIMLGPISWIALFVLNGLAVLCFLCAFVEKLLEKKFKD